MHLPLEAGLVRIWEGDEPVGAGFLAGPRHVVSAAHVVSGVLGLSADEAPREGASVSLDFPLLAPGRRQLAEVVAWRPPGPEQGMDVVGLRLREPPPAAARPLVLSRRRGELDGSLVMVGFPRGLELGTWVHGRLGGPVATGWVEIESDPARQAMLSPGFSGAPVWSTDADAAVGMVGYRVTGAGAKIGYMLPVDMLLAAWPELAEVIEQRVPYRALRPFTEQDADLYHGREELAGQIADRVRSGAPLICVIGGSGVGKSSLWHAGVVPRLRATDSAGTVRLPLALRPSDAATPLTALAFALDRLMRPGRTAPAARLESVAATEARLAGGQLPDLVAAVLEEHRADQLVVCVDQFEEVFAAPDADRSAFVRALLPCLAPGSRLCLLVNLRDTFLGTALADRAIAELARAWLPVTVGEMTQAELRRVMTGPLERVGTVAFADGLVERILDDLAHTPNPLPLLAFALAELWQRRRAGLLTHAAYEELGGISEALARYADRIWAGIDPATREVADRLLIQLVRPLPDGDLAVRRTALRDECDEDQWLVGQRLATSRLLVMHRMGGDPSGASGIELAHDSLLLHWRHLRALGDEHRAFRLWQDTLRQRMATWSEQGRPGRRVLAGAELRDARRWVRTHHAHLSTGELDYIAAGRVRRWRVNGTVGLALALALVAGTLTYQHRSEQVAQSLAGTLRTRAEELASADSYGAMQLGLRSYRTHPGSGLPDVFGGLGPVDRIVPNLGAATTAPHDASPAPPPTAQKPLPLSYADQMALQDLTPLVAAGGRTLVTRAPGGQIVPWRDTGHGLVAEPLDGVLTANDLADKAVIGRDGRYLAFPDQLFPDVTGKRGAPGSCPVPDAMSTATTVCLVVYDTVERRVVFGTAFPPLPRVGRFVASIDPNNRVLGMVLPDSIMPTTAAGQRNTLYLLDLKTGRLLRKAALPWRSAVFDFWLGPDGASAILSETEADDSSVRTDVTLTRVRTGPDRITRTALADPARTQSFVTSPDGRTVAAVLKGRSGAPAELRAWDIATGARTGYVPRLDPAEADGVLALNSTGTAAWFSLSPDVDAVNGDAGLAAKAVSGVSIRSLATGKRVGRSSYPLPWSTLIPLGESPNGPVLLVHGTSLGVVSAASGGRSPLQRVADAAGAGPRDPLGKPPGADRVCALLGPQANDAATTGKLVPAGAYDGALCP
ncbi:serine protease [Streptomyces sp. RS10V-4]|uniref:nSTAND1 domain-containing NTPase n=1 Tax=Streptomyces rhizoryzae TaxID=2932493 RepID=UPI002006C056|nr:trypsin-like peptidase domain-containing protein [Streptomyces rhizoryzae]MCK7625906.1 serine protease [Streptomyces rhizoryzae]